MHDGTSIPKYQPHVDGLRAVAVTAVILFHAHAPLFQGGYLGVDVFFVISGFLITSNIAGQVAQGRFSLRDFYLRRARRILPALLLVLLCSCGAAYAILTPSQLRDFEHTVLANLVFASNFLFAEQTDYFSAPAELKPLIHTWSLAVEEQFYLLYPAILLLAARRRWRPAVVVGVLGALSLGAGLLWRTHFPSATFYLMPTRAWEMATGALAALLVLQAGPRLEAIRRGAGAWFLLGLTLMVVALLFPATFPDVFSVAAVLGAALVIVAGRFTPWSSLLSARPVVLVGLMSYSLYLWHQPVFAFLRAYVPAPLTTTQHGLAILATVLLSYASWRFVERPFRSARAVPVRPLLGSLAGGAALLAGFSLAAQFTQGLPARLNPAARMALAAETDVSPRHDSCSSTLLRPLPLERACTYPQADGHADVLLAGDSHAGALAYSLGQVLGARRSNVRSLLLYGCAPLLLDSPRFNPQERQCVRYQRRLIEYIRRSDARSVVLFNRWSAYFAGPYTNPQGGVETADGPGNFYRSGVGAEEMTRSYVDLIGQILASGKTVVLVYPVPDMGWNVPTTLYKNAAFGFHTEVMVRTSDYLARNAQVIRAFDALTSPGLRRVRPADLLCQADGGQTCVSSLGGQIMYYDDDHLTLHGAARLSHMILAQLPAPAAP
ncbi:acyltransferase family protein [Deinococcus sp. KSM4-11]|uniref:acyltransferase family protein n=1 Tax=Deinococcus sp. KSM4-11 TaxID=2568654 RepID=UPI0021063866|nr:acyltransferase family protein [Deinococcus sp. KSM4-11]